MGYKYKPHKGIKERVAVSKTGKIKHRREKNSHLRSARTAKTKRQLGRSAVLAEGHAKNMREYLGLKGRRPKATAAARAAKLAAAAKATTEKVAA